MVKRAKTSFLFLLENAIQEMKNEEKIFIENVKIETQTTYCANGNINIYPCPWELGKYELAAERVSQKGRMVTEEDGTSRFRPYRAGSGTRYRQLMQTAHGELKSTLENVIVRLVLPKRLLTEQMVKALLEETDVMADWLGNKEGEEL